MRGAGKKAPRPGGNKVAGSAKSGGAVNMYTYDPRALLHVCRDNSALECHGATATGHAGFLPGSLVPFYTVIRRQ